MFNAANEMAGKAFMDGRIGFMDIARVIDLALSRAGDRFSADLSDVVSADKAAREFAHTLVEEMTR
jgi:1-deoxy-D-xylulose-5-phosphate reductoisomerase